MRSIYQKELKTYLSNILTYVFIVLLLSVYTLLFTNRIFGNHVYYTNVVNYELPIYRLIMWITSLIPILMFLNYTVQKDKRIDTHLYTSTIPSLKIIIAKILAISTIFIMPFAIILFVNTFLMLTVYTASAMVLSIYILIGLMVLLSASFSSMMYTLFKNPIIALIVSVILQNLLIIVFSGITYFERLLFMPYLQGLIPLATSLILTCLIIVYTTISTLILNSKRNIL